MTVARDAVIAAARASFPGRDTAAVVELLDLYGTESYEREREWVQLGILTLCGGSMEKLGELVQVAKVDYREILAWVETGPLSELQGREARDAALDVLRRWGKKES